MDSINFKWRTEEQNKSVPNGIIEDRFSSTRTRKSEIFYCKYIFNLKSSIMRYVHNLQKSSKYKIITEERQIDFGTRYLKCIF